MRVVVPFLVRDLDLELRFQKVVPRQRPQMLPILAQGLLSICRNRYPSNWDRGAPRHFRRTLLARRRCSGSGAQSLRIDRSGRSFQVRRD